MKKEEVNRLLTDESVSAEQAEILSDCLTTADKYGVTSHGTAILSAHIQRIKNGGYNLKPNIKTVKETPSFAIVDGDNAIGPVSASYCVNLAMKKAKESGVYTVFGRNNNTFGPAFYYPLKAAQDGFIGFICSNSPAQMAPFGGKEKMLGTNPFSAVIPVPNDDPIIIDMATSVVAKSKFKEYKAEGKSLPEGWALDKNGNPTTDPDEAMSGLVLPMAGFKGYAISLLIDVIAGALSGSAYLNNVGRFYSDKNESMNIGFYVCVIDPSVVFGEGWGEVVKNYKKSIESSAAIEGRTVVLPGADRIKKAKEQENKGN